VNSTATTNWGYQATVGTAARTRWSAATALAASRHAFAAISPMPSNLVVVKDHKGIRHRPPEDSS
jgi:hypothetical protein